MRMLLLYIYIYIERYVTLFVECSSKQHQLYER